MEEYIVQYERTVTPIYPADAAAIVHSLDLHVSPEIENSNGPLEVLEAGTGHGSLTLHLARALHAGYAGRKGERYSGYPTAYLHSVDKSKASIRAAENLIKGFRRGMYSGKSLKFYRSDLEFWLRLQLNLRKNGSSPHGIPDRMDWSSMIRNSSSESELLGETEFTEDVPFLSACVLDMPDIRPVLPLLQRALHRGAIVGYWAPSVTQIADVIRYLKMHKSPFYVEKVLEFVSGNSGAGAKAWDVRMAKVKSRDNERAANVVNQPTRLADRLQEMKRARAQSTQKGNQTTKAELPRPSKNLAKFQQLADRFQQLKRTGAQTIENSDPLIKEDPQNDDQTIEKSIETQQENSTHTPHSYGFENVDQYEMVCRPKVGDRTVGGGFYLLMRRTAYDEEPQRTLRPTLTENSHSDDDLAPWEKMHLRSMSSAGKSVANDARLASLVSFLGKE
ncbi:hypothetical protein ABW20_dc0102709 [Dactylellina cionopaga]|nr:hypothetical protein ABW20_dc0102709 [Dactylellina cionopaga]